MGVTRLFVTLFSLIYAFFEFLYKKTTDVSSTAISSMPLVLNHSPSAKCLDYRITP